MRVETVIAERVELRFLEPETEAEANESTVDCDGCRAPCCRSRHLDAVPLSRREAQRLPHGFGTVRLENGRVLQNVATLPRHPITKECVFIEASGRCSIWPERPAACRAYSCLKDEQPEMKAFARERFGR